MSERLKEALRVMKEVLEEEKHSPIIYLHDPETLHPFGALIDLDTCCAIPDEIEIQHSHREGDEDEWDENVGS